ncbi:MAG: amino acid permease [Candidatus Obscuribacterales bacterium]
MPGKSKPQLHIETELSRDLGLTAALAIGVGTMIAAGIFTLSGLAIRNVGSSAIFSFLLAGGVSMFTALTYCEFSSIYPESGEAYLYSRRTFRAPLAYVVGWCLFLGYTSSCAFYLSSLSKYFFEFVWKTPVEAASGVVALLGLTLLNIKGTKESGQFQIVVTLAKVVLLLWFVTGGLASVNVDLMVGQISYDIGRIASTAAMVFITFFGFSAIAASAGEVKDPIKTIPRAIFISMTVVTLLYSAVVMVLIAAGLTEYTEAAMGTAAKLYLGDFGGYVIIGGAIFSMISASNASIMAGSRVMLSMSRLGHFPAEFGIVNKSTRTPIISLVLVGGAILAFTVGLNIEDLAHFADTVLLVALIFVNAALIVHRRKFKDIERPFKVPMVPLMPALGILANLYLLLQIVHHPIPLAMASGSIILGMVAFLAWKGFQADETVLPGAPSRVALQRSATTQKHPFRILVPLANPDNVPLLIELAAGIARDRNGEIVTLRVAVVPEQLPPSREDPIVQRQRQILELAHETALQYGVPVTSLVRIGHDAGRAILETSRERDCDLIVLGWKGYTTTREKILGEVVDAVVNHARADVILVKPGKEKTEGPLRKFLLPSAGGEHARCAASHVGSILSANGGSVTVCGVLRPDVDEKESRLVTDRLEESREKISRSGDVTADSRLIRHKSVSVGVIETAKEYDAVVVGAAGGSIYPQIIFGSIPESIARYAGKPVILVKHYHPVKALIGRVVGQE